MADNAAEVAEDYRQALEDLTVNSRIEIATLTNIARENAHHGFAISEALANHIKKVPPARTLPALYVLDSVVKNVPTPYALYFGPKLYSVFMGAYTKVDNATRRKMDEMLKTWKEPVPGSISTKPVFPLEQVRPIEHALMAARNAAYAAQQNSFQGQQQLMRGRQPAPSRDTPTPPTTRSYQPPAPQPSYPGANGHRPDAAQRPYPMPLVSSQDMPQDQLMIIRDRVAELAVKFRPQLPVTAGPAGGGVAAPNTGYPGVSYTTTPTPPVVSQQPTPVPPAAAAVVAAALGRPQSAASAPPAAGGGVSIDSLFGQGALAALISGTARKSATPQQTPTPQPPPPAPAPAPAPAIGPAAAAAIAAALRSPPPQVPTEPPKPPASAPPASNPSALLAMLRQSGLIKPSGTPTPPPAASALPGFGARGFQSLAGLTLDPNPQLRPASLKTFRPHMISKLHEDLGPPCTQCGRRFKTNEDGRRKKTAHMDWHFRVHQRMTDAEKRGQHRSWYVDESDWIHTREAIDTDYTHPPQDPSSTSALDDPTAASGSGGAHHSAKPNSTSAAGAAAAAAAAARAPYIPVPEDSARVNNACPICQEKFEMKWLDEAQEWVWTDALRVGGRVFHASCHREAYGAQAGMGQGQGVLGKRKAEHYAGEVEYPVKGLVEENGEVISGDLMNLINSSKSSFVARLFGQEVLKTVVHPQERTTVMQASVSSRPMRAPSIMSRRGRPSAY
ncbi:hypothetical protein CHGG_10352 [Chaetomium globosum CBS 148.51]|uniref:CID domain-containing protein n=1 Tax=Chaetomium globosum (strain ATCC 6205 / CBS 148.51 / DSM 1962 / NBRC 6347 / NRRL 1970) TaxID=306901 RepID=Q2GNV2_CHAGB|nr:uncharacterized protein CHGG_10352 [Chaetomium globosum CBS 148.51]EAQ83948.1 hypothetical protein CHGG_10352 [Chaetomium globosum CBS 148.51]